MYSPYLASTLDQLVPKGGIKSLVMVVVYRDRVSQLEEFLKTVPDYLETRGYDWRIIIAEQRDGSPFNRGLMINMGYLSGRRLFPQMTHTVFSDVDTYPVDRSDSFDYSGIKGGVNHIFCGYEQNVGGIVNFDNTVFESINGFPNHLWGWGHEDFAAKRRLDAIGVTVTRTNTVFKYREDHRERFRQYDHDRDMRYKSTNRVKAYKDTSKTSGLNMMPLYRECFTKLGERIIKIRYDFDDSIIDTTMDQRPSC